MTTIGRKNSETDNSNRTSVSRSRVSLPPTSPNINKCTQYKCCCFANWNPKRSECRTTQQDNFNKSLCGNFNILILHASSYSSEISHVKKKKLRILNLQIHKFQPLVCQLFGWPFQSVSVCTGKAVHHIVYTSTSTPQLWSTTHLCTRPIDRPPLPTTFVHFIPLFIHKIHSIEIHFAHENGKSRGRITLVAPILGQFP